MTQQQLFSQQQYNAGVSQLRVAYPDGTPPAPPPPPPMSYTPWLIGGVLLAGGLYLLFRD